MKAAWLALLAAMPAGCLGAEPSRCTDGFPLVLQTYPSVSNASMLQVQTALWNCTDDPIALREPCRVLDGLLPRFDLGNETYYLSSFSNGDARRAARLECPEVGRASHEAQPGDHIEQIYSWAGTIEGEPAPPGAYEVYVEAGGWRDGEEVRVPW